MKILNNFKLFLVTSNTSLSSSTVKNYLADINHFLHWFEETYSKPFEESLFNTFVVAKYQKTKGKTALKTLSDSSFKRHMFSLKKFSTFLKQNNHIKIDPFTSINTTQTSVVESDIWHIKALKRNLYNASKSPLTIKNYIHDILHFTSWISKGLAGFEKPTISLLTSELTHQYKEYLNSSNYSISSINRKLSSVRIYYNFLLSEGLLKHKAEVAENGKIEKPLSITDLTREEAAMHTYSSFAPLRLAQKIHTGVDIAEDKISDTIITALHLQPTQDISKDNKIDQLVKGVSKITYKPHAISTQHFPIHKKITHTLRYKRPGWYKAYHAHSISHYVHFSILIATVSIMSVSLYNNTFSTKLTTQVLGASTTPSKIIPYTAILSDKNGKPITESSTLHFGIYNSPTSSQNALIWEETQQDVIPSATGQITVNLGLQKQLDPSIFTSSQPLFLGVSVNGSEELQPRQPLVTTSLSKNSESLSGMKPLTTSRSHANAILAFDSSGNLTLDGEQDTTFQATNANLTLSATSVTLTTNPGSNGNITFKPDGLGAIDVQGALMNSTSSGTLIPGGVEVHDRFGILASESAQAAFIINNESLGGDLFTASSSGLTKFVIDTNGNVGIGQQKPIYSLDVLGTTRLSGPTILNNISYIWPEKQEKDAILTTNGAGELSWINPSKINAVWKEENGYLKTADDVRPILIGSANPNDAKFAFTDFATNPTFTVSNTLSLASSSIQTKGSVLSITANGALSGNIQIGNSNGTADLLVLDSNSSATDPAGVNGAMYYNASTNKFRCFQNGAWKNCDTGSGADLAEVYYSFDQTLSPGEIVSIDSTLNNGVKRNDAAKSSEVLGVVATEPGIILSDNKKSVGTPVNLALSGRVPVQIAESSDPIQPGDFITSSFEAGKAMKANSASYIIGKALEGWTKNEGKKTVTIFIERSFYDPYLALSQRGDLLYRNSLITAPDFEKILSTSNNSVITNSVEKLLAAIAISSDDFKNYIFSSISENSSGLFAQKIISPLSEIDTIHTNRISGLTEKKSIALEFEKDKLSLYNSIASSSAVASFDTAGNASFAGTLRSENLETHDATISGTLYANSIQANQIAGLNEKIASVAATFDLNTTNIPTLADYKPHYVDSASFSAQLALVSENFLSLGTSTLREATITDSLTVGPSMKFSTYSINVIGNDLELQDLRQGGINFLAGAFHIDQDGNINAQGNADFQKDVTIHGNLATNTISPLSNSDLNVILSSSSSAQLKIGNDGGSFAVNNKGDFTASGAGTLSKLNFNLISEAIATSQNEATATTSAGIAKLTAHQKELTIFNPKATEKSLIYITPTGDTDGGTLYLARQSDQSFTVAITQRTNSDIPFNWIIIN